MSSLIADIGGTNARFALVADGSTEAGDPMVFPCADFASPADAALAYLQRLRPDPMPRRGAFAIASPVTGDRVEMTNHVWRFSVAETRDRLRLEQLEVVNDFTAVALAVPYLQPPDRVTVGGHAAIDGMPMAVIGPGTGLGVSALLPSRGGWLPIPSEGGHITMAAADEREAKVIAWLRGRRGHVSAERVLSGPGLVNLYTALRGLLGLDEEALTPAQVTDMAAKGDPLAREAMAMFFAMLGTVAGNLALTLGAKGGVVIAGGIVPRHLPAFLASDFRQRFEDKGRFRSWLEPIPVHVATHPFPAFLGLANFLNNQVSS
ncbi:MAG TPA: glucokinase [Rhodospirillaceae bacterium]|nr:glucokinase [Rhodospirillaceae bacterium]